MSRGLPLNVKLCLDKALDSALLSVETYLSSTYKCNFLGADNKQ